MPSQKQTTVLIHQIRHVCQIKLHQWGHKLDVSMQIWVNKSPKIEAFNSLYYKNCNLSLLYNPLNSLSYLVAILKLIIYIVTLYSWYLILFFFWVFSVFTLKTKAKNNIWAKPFKYIFSCITICSNTTSRMLYLQFQTRMRHKFSQVSHSMEGNT